MHSSFKADFWSRQQINSIQKNYPVDKYSHQIADSPLSPVRILMTCSTGLTKILPSPIFPVCAALTMVSIALSSILSVMISSIFTLGRKSTTYSAPRYNSVWPFWRPKPLTSVTVNPATPISDKASLTSSSLNGLITASIFFNLYPLFHFTFTPASQGRNPDVIGYRRSRPKPRSVNRIPTAACLRLYSLRSIMLITLFTTLSS